MIHDPAIDRAANALIRQYGDEAPAHAAMRADTMLKRGDVKGYAVWKGILKAVDALLAKDRPAGTKPH